MSSRHPTFSVFLFEPLGNTAFNIPVGGSVVVKADENTGSRGETVTLLVTWDPKRNVETECLRRF
jgi:hypothetical protein